MNEEIKTDKQTLDSTKTDTNPSSGSPKKEGKQGKPNNKHTGGKPQNKQDKRLRYSKNDYRFYAPTEQIAKDLGSVPLNNIGGTQLNMEIYAIGSNSKKESIQTKAIPSAAVIEYIPSFGVAKNKVDSINMAATQLYVYVRHQNSGARNYEAPDMMMVELAVEDIFTNLIEASRVIKTAGYYRMMNHNVPDLLIKAMGFYPDDLRNNLAAYRGRLNLLIEKANSFALPNYFKSLLRRGFVASNVFRDSASDRGQYYIYRKNGYYVWSPTTETTGSSLVYKKIRTSLYDLINLDDFLNMIEEQLNAIFLDSDPNTIFGDILKAFSTPGALFGLNQVGEQDVINPSFDEDALAQIENMMLFQPNNASTYSTPNEPTLESLKVTQSNQMLIWQPQISFTRNVSISTAREYMITNPIMNSHKESIDYKDILEWSRLMPTWDISLTNDGSSATAVTYTLTSCGLETPIHMVLMTTDPERPNGLDIVPISQTPVSSTGLTLNQATSIMQLINYDWHPFIYYGSSTSLPLYFGGDTKVTGVMPKGSLININQQAAYACYYGNNLYNSDSKK